jgi:hypothetical protein
MVRIVRDARVGVVGSFFLPRNHIFNPLVIYSWNAQRAAIHTLRFKPVRRRRPMNAQMRRIIRDRAHWWPGVEARIDAIVSILRAKVRKRVE